MSDSKEIDWDKYRVDVDKNVTFEFYIDGSYGPAFGIEYDELEDYLVDLVLFELAGTAINNLEEYFNDNFGGGWDVTCDSISECVGDNHYIFYIKEYG